jgi:hypothetical protein
MIRTEISPPEGFAMTAWFSGKLQVVAEAVETGMIVTAKPAKNKRTNLCMQSIIPATFSWLSELGADGHAVHAWLFNETN